MAKTRKGKPGRPKGSGVKGHVQMLLQVRPDQREALLELAEAERKPGETRTPVSEVARKLLDEALRKRGR